MPSTQLALPEQGHPGFGTQASAQGGLSFQLPPPPPLPAPLCLRLSVCLSVSLFLSKMGSYW